MNYENSLLSPKLLRYAASLQMNDLRVECAACPTLICVVILGYEPCMKGRRFFSTISVDEFDSV